MKEDDWIKKKWWIVTQITVYFNLKIPGSSNEYFQAISDLPQVIN